MRERGNFQYAILMLMPKIINIYTLTYRSISSSLSTEHSSKSFFYSLVMAVLQREGQLDSCDDISHDQTPQSCPGEL